MLHMNTLVKNLFSDICKLWVLRSVGTYAQPFQSKRILHFGQTILRELKGLEGKRP